MGSGETALHSAFDERGGEVWPDPWCELLQAPPDPITGYESPITNY
jgi:hypothetical protein